MLRQKFASSSERFSSNKPSLFQDTDNLPIENEPIYEAEGKDIEELLPWNVELS